MRALVASSLVALSVVAPVRAAAGVAAEEVRVAVFEGRGVGHGAGLPLDGANALALADASADDILERFFPGASRGKAEGLVRVLLAARDDLRTGIEVTLPDGGVVRDGRTTPVAPSFPLTVPKGGRVRLTFTDGFSRAEVLDERSVSGTLEITPSSAAPDPAAPSPTAPPTTGGGGSGTTPPTAPGLGASKTSLWVEPRRGGRILVAPENGGEPQTHRGLTEMVIEAERLHLVAELDVEDYLKGVDLTLPGGTDLEPVALDAAVIAARSYALRSARAESRIGRFHLFADDRSLRYVGVDDAPKTTATAVLGTSGKVIEHDGLPAAAMITTSAGGQTAGGEEVFGPPGGDLPYLAPVEYPVGDEFRWRAEMSVADLASRLGQPLGDAEIAGIEIVATGRSGRPTRLRVAAADGAIAAEVEAFHSMLRLPSSAFEVRIESRPEAPPAGIDAAPFQELPGTALSDAALAGDDVEQPGDRRGGVPFPVVAVAGLSLVVAFLVLLVADVQRRMRAARERRAARLRHPTDSAEIPVVIEPDPAALARANPVPAPERGEAPTQRTAERRAERQAEPAPERAPGVRAEPSRWHNEPDWLADLVPDAPAPPSIGDVDENALTREFQRLHDNLVVPHPDEFLSEDEEPPPTRPLSEILGWDDAPEWLDQPEHHPTDEREDDTKD